MNNSEHTRETPYEDEKREREKMRERQEREGMIAGRETESPNKF